METNGAILPHGVCKRGHDLAEHGFAWTNPKTGATRFQCRTCAQLRRKGLAEPIPLVTECKNGHDLTHPDSYYQGRGSSRACKICHKAYHEANYYKRGNKKRPAPRISTDPLTLAYAAGVFDGEGTVGIRCGHYNKNRGRIHHSVTVAITSTDRALIDWLIEHFGGNAGANHAENAARNYKDAWKWTLLAKHAEAFLKAVRPFLIIKGQQADVALELRADLGDGTNTPLTEEVFARREALKQEMHRLNARGRTPITEVR